MTDKENIRRVILCGCISRNFMDRDKVARMAALFAGNGCDVKIVPDLCRLAETEREKLSFQEIKVVVACHERAVKHLLEWVGEKKAPLLLNLRKDSVETLAQKAGLDQAKAELLRQDTYRDMLDGFVSEKGNDAWFPVIDRERCVDCGQCHDFCLFGVYSVDGDGKIQVTAPQQCKIDCPACARVCPQEAVIFPKHDFAPINGGDGKEENAFRVDTKQLYNQALRERLAARRAGISLLKRK